LFTYVLHYYIYFGLLPALHIPYSIFWPLIFIASLLLMSGAASLWDAADLNRRFVLPSLSLPVRVAASPD
jgi:hypothetical protein